MENDRGVRIQVLAYSAPPPVSPSSWEPKTFPLGYTVNFFGINTPYGPGVHIDTAGTSEYLFDFLAYKNTTTYRVRDDGTIRFEGWFRQDDTFPSYLLPSRRMLKVYIRDSTAGTILKDEIVLDHDDGTDWLYVYKTVYGLTLGQTVRIGFGRPDLWERDWNLAAEWADVKIYGE